MVAFTAKRFDAQDISPFGEVSDVPGIGRRPSFGPGAHTGPRRLCINDVGPGGAIVPRIKKRIGDVGIGGNEPIRVTARVRFPVPTTPSHNPGQINGGGVVQERMVIRFHPGDKRNGLGLKIAGQKRGRPRFQ